MTVRRSKQRSHHDQLLRRLEWRPGTAAAGRPLDAIVVPASRKAHHLAGVVSLAARYGTTLVVLASHRCEVAATAELIAGTPGSGRAVIAEIPAEGDVESLRLATSAERFRELSGERSSNLSLKRNLGLLLARHLGWQKIMFLDDDIIGLTRDDVARVAHHLDSNRYAGLKTLAFPDNSVVCHANRDVGRPQGIFVSGAALGVRTAPDVDVLDVFPDVYNEDWFALAGEAHRTGVAHVGAVRQLEYNPYADPQRAVHEEFGDLLAEGLYALFNDGLGLPRATADYWEQFLTTRAEFIEDIRQELERTETHQSLQASKSLHEARMHLDVIRTENCTDFLDAWQQDRRRFAELSRVTSGQRRTYRDAFAELGVTRWQEARFGIARMPETPELSLAGSRR